MRVLDEENRRKNRIDSQCVMVMFHEVIRRSRREMMTTSLSHTQSSTSNQIELRSLSLSYNTLELTGRIKFRREASRCEPGPAT